MTVVKDSPLAHKDKGWEIFTDDVIKLLNKKETPVVFILWGNYAKAKKALITNPIHLVIESAHPSPFSAHNGFFGSKPFSKTNEFLKKNNIKEIDWRVE
jgi:uracil-DNA glycosylase